MTLPLLLSQLTACSLLVREYEVDDDKTTKIVTEIYTKADVTAAAAEIYSAPSGKSVQTALSALADSDCEGDIFLIATVTGDNVGENPIWQAEDSLTYSSSISRIQAVADKYNLKITPYKTGYDELAPTLAENIANYSYTADLLVVPASLADTLVESELVLNLSHAPFFDKTAYFFDSSVIDYYNGGDCYAVYGDALESPESTLCVFYNRNLAAKLGFDDIYSLADSGKWTFERLMTMSGEGGLSCEISMSYILQSLCGEEYSDIFDKSGKIAKADGRAAEMLDTVNSLGEKFTEEGALEKFISGGSLFYIGRITDAAELSAMTDGWSFVPLPNLTESGDSPSDYPTVHDYADEKWLFLVPLDAAVSERSVLVMSALCAATCDEAKIELRGKLYEYLRTNDARIMIDKILGIGG